MRPHGQTGAGPVQVGPGHVVGGAVSPSPFRSRCRLPSTKAATHAADGASPTSTSRSAGASRSATAQSHSKSVTACSHSDLEQLGRAVRLDEPRRGGERGQAGIVAVGAEGPHVLHVDAVDLADLADQQVEQVRLRERDDQLVDGPPAAALEDLDAHDVAPDGADAAGDLAQRTRPVGEPDPQRGSVGTAGDGTDGTPVDRDDRYVTGS